jgi:hypothetical protein
VTRRVVDSGHCFADGKICRIQRQDGSGATGPKSQPSAFENEERRAVQIEYRGYCQRNAQQKPNVRNRSECIISDDRSECEVMIVGGYGRAIYS